ncbi:hypothetical protein [Neobacillus citreus]|uniref:Uncharacterized protein n=1 Tax=Neobacillus citreus TaxID=2833578 RepID=A0A942T8K7_9BACI|nr:hypothetical protein [Neobacillus citreus]MCH6269337.1 hypothetical protein [Neobacillus citreus]
MSHSPSGSNSSPSNTAGPTFPADCANEVAVLDVNPGNGRVQDVDFAPDNIVLQGCTITTTGANATPLADAVRCLSQNGFRFLGSVGNRAIFIRC